MKTEGRRKLAAIMFTDIVGYSSIMMGDETKGRLLRQKHRLIFEEHTAAHNGRIVQYFGDGTVSMFESAVSATVCAVEMQKRLIEADIPVRVGIHLGDIFYDDTELYGHGVNVAARIEPMCHPGGILISDKVYDEITNQEGLKADSMGVYKFRKIDQEIGLFAIRHQAIPVPTQTHMDYMNVLSTRISDQNGGSMAFHRFRKEKSRLQRRRFLGAIAAGLLLMVFSLPFIKRTIQAEEILTATSDPSNLSLAVLPFKNLNDSPASEYLTDDITDHIREMLISLDGVGVTSRTSMMQYQHSEKGIHHLVNELDVSHIVEGTLRQEGNRIHIEVQLIDARANERIWAQTYNQELTDLIEVQNLLVSDIGRQLRRNLFLQDQHTESFQNPKCVVACSLVPEPSLQDLH